MMGAASREIKASYLDTAVRLPADTLDSRSQNRWRYRRRWITDK